eukprot:TRINITY_DN527_c0_g1_i1.p2 TRINITY_DN527_c0_g1~~TRINITY_DN527_c0_g1_i1.p2  ORF type:complete len:334 (+),score=129.31 TRINITY_DN527_c0_g1_i1:48-1004(+)
MVKSILIVAMLAAVALARPEREYRSAFMKFMKDYGKTYTSNEFAMRYNVFKGNMDFIDAWNAQDHHRVGVNRFADLTVAEFSKTFKGVAYVHTADYAYEPSVTAAGVDWRTKGAVTPVKNEGQCGACWAFSATGALEGVHAISSGKLVSLSEQNLIDCSGPEGNQGCDGGFMTNAFAYVKNNSGIDTEASYPYTGTQGPCRFKRADVGATISSWTNIKAGSEADLVAKINQGPVSAAIDASQSSFQLYQSGVYYDAACSSKNLDFAVTVVGYGTQGSKDYYIAKNDWGTNWGDKGYILMSRNRNNNCGIATMATLPVV